MVPRFISKKFKYKTERKNKGITIYFSRTFQSALQTIPSVKQVLVKFGQTISHGMIITTDCKFIASQIIRLSLSVLLKKSILNRH